MKDTIQKAGLHSSEAFYSICVFLVLRTNLLEMNKQFKASNPDETMINTNIVEHRVVVASKQNMLSVPSRSY